MTDNPTVQLRRISSIDPLTIELLERYFGLSLADQYDWLEALKIVTLNGDNWLFRQNDPGDALYFLVRGRLQVWRNADDPKHEQSGVMLGEITPGESVGEAGLLSGLPRTAGVRAIRDSRLVRVDREAFERIAKLHPGLVMKLAASVAIRARQNIAMRPAGTRPLRTIALVPLDDSPRVTEFCNALVAGLNAEGKTLDLHRDKLGAVGAPLESLAPLQIMDDLLKNWLHKQEFETRFVVYRADQAPSPWSRFAVRQSDLLLLVAESSADPQRRQWEDKLITGKEVLTGSRRALVLLQPDSKQPIRGTAKWLEPRRVDFHFHVRQDREDDVQRVIRVLTGQATGVVFGGGGARGFAHLGVYRALTEMGPAIDWVGGASIGAVIGCAAAFNWEPQRATETAHEVFIKGKPFSDDPIPRVSPRQASRMLKLSRKYLDVQIEDLPIPFFCVSSDLTSGVVRVHDRGSLWDAIRASAALPGIMPPVNLDGHLIVDGAVLNKLPVDVMQSKPVGQVIAVELSDLEVSAAEDLAAAPSAWTQMRARLMPTAPQFSVSGLTALMLRAIDMGNQARVRELGARADLLLQPPVEKYAAMQWQAFDDLVELGHQCARNALLTWNARNKALRNRRSG